MSTSDATDAEKIAAVAAVMSDETGYGIEVIHRMYSDAQLLALWQEQP